MSIVWNPNTGRYALLVKLDEFEAISISEGTYEEMVENFAHMSNYR